MIVVKTRVELQEKIGSAAEDSVIGFVPTMGALHNGHCSLIDFAVKESDFTVASIFVNPTQFNDANDLKNYPRTIESDLKLLEQHGCDLVYIPDVDDVYYNKRSFFVDLKGLDKVMEGEFRPGHFDGVVDVVSRLFDIVKPDKAFFGEKDFQQLSIIRYMSRDLNVDVVGCPTVRESDGLAMSSRNMLLEESYREEASVIYKSLSWAKDNFKEYAVGELKAEIEKRISETGKFIVEYVNIVESDTLISIDEWTDNNVNCCVAVYAGKVRLIDNIKLNY
jgi:pantoate--beta-alanine ligase